MLRSLVGSEMCIRDRSNGANTITLQIPQGTDRTSTATRGNIVRNVERDKQVLIQLRKGSDGYSNILHVPVVSGGAKNRALRFNRAFSSTGINTSGTSRLSAGRFSGLKNNQLYKLEVELVIQDTSAGTVDTAVLAAIYTNARGASAPIPLSPQLSLRASSGSGGNAHAASSYASEYFTLADLGSAGEMALTLTLTNSFRAGIQTTLTEVNDVELLTGSIFS